MEEFLNLWFWLILGLESTKILKRDLQSKESKALVNLFNQSFDSDIHPDDKKSVKECFKQGSSLSLIGFDNKGKSRHYIASVLYHMSQDGIYINWIFVDSLR